MKNTHDIIEHEKSELRHSMENLILFICNNNNGIINLEEMFGLMWGFWIIRADGKMICANEASMVAGSDGQRVIFNEHHKFFEGDMSNLPWGLLPSIILGNDTPVKMNKNNDYAIDLMEHVHYFDLEAWAEEGRANQLTNVNSAMTPGF